MRVIDKELYYYIGEQIKSARERRGISLDTLVSLIGGEKTKSTLKRYEDGVSRIELDTLELICNKLDIDYKEVVKNAKMKASQKAESLTPIDIIYNDYFPLHYHTNLSAGSFDELLDSEPDAVVYVPIVFQSKKNRLHAFRVNGTSMNNVIEDGSIVVVEMTDKSNIKDGTIVVAFVDGCATVKRIYINGDTITLMPDSSDKKHQPMVFGDDSQVFVIGRVLWHMNPENIADYY